MILEMGLSSRGQIIKERQVEILICHRLEECVQRQWFVRLGALALAILRELMLIIKQRYPQSKTHA